MTSVLFFVAGMAIQADPVDALYKFPVGTTWTFVGTEQPKTGHKTDKAELKVLKAEGGVIEVESRATQEGRDEPDEGTLRWAVADGILTWEQLRGEKTSDVMKLYKVGAAKGETWTWTRHSETIRGTFVGREEVKVAAGTYPEAYHVKLDSEKEEFHFEVFLAPGVGPVKLVASLGPDSRNVMELKEFKPAK